MTAPLSPILVLWGVTPETYTLLHELRSARFSLKERAEYLNNHDVPPPYCYDCDSCDAGDNAERSSSSNGIERLFRRCQKWTASNWLQMSSALGRDIRERHGRSEMQEPPKSMAASMMNSNVTNSTAEIRYMRETEASEVERWDNEDVAAKIVAALLDGEYHLQDTQVGPDSSKKHDYDIRTHDSRTTALEVTQQVNSEQRRQQEYIDSKLASLRSYQHDWSVRVRGEARLEGLPDHLPEMLAKLDELNIHSLCTGGGHSLPPFMVRLRELAVKSIGCRQMTTGPGCINVHADSESVSTSHELVVSIANGSLRRKADKLRRAEADERHLWIWIDGEEFSSSAALRKATFIPPSTLPDMTPGGVGEGIDVVWIAGSWTEGSDGSPKTPIFRCDGTGWEQVALPADVQQIITDAVERSRPR